MNRRPSKAGKGLTVFNFINKLKYYPDKLEAFRESNHSRTLATVLLYMASGICNNDCIYCDKNFYEISPVQFDRDYLDCLINDMVDMGADSLIILGEGAEPLLCKELCHLIENASEHGIACGIYTNGSIVDDCIIRAFNKLDFLRISLDAGNTKTHRLIHKYDVKYDYYDNALEMLRRVDKDKVNTGVSYIIMKENVDEIYDTWKVINSLGVSFMELKLPIMAGYIFAELDDDFREKIREQLDKIDKEHGGTLKVVPNNHLKMLLGDSTQDSMTLTVQSATPCYTCMFRTIVSPLGYYLCSPRKNTEEAKYGDPLTESLKVAWNSKKCRAMTGRDCTIRCTYYQQNKVLLELMDGKQIDFDETGVAQQTHFL